MSSDFLQILNDRLIGLDEHLSLPNEKKHNIFIVGAPRSGTTLLNQMFSGCTKAGYVNNLMAAFWNAPITGALFSGRWNTDKYFAGESNFGQTNNFREPHEFGAFWRNALKMHDMSQPPAGFADKVDWEKLSDTLSGISKVFGQPVVYKAFHLSWFISEINKVMPDSKWLWITRNTTDNARSILDLRRSFHGDISKWVSLKPACIEQYSDGGPYLEVVAQVELINEWIYTELLKINKDKWLKISLDSLVENPVRDFNKISLWSGVEVIEENLNSACLHIKPERFPDDAEYLEIKNALNTYYSHHG